MKYRILLIAFLLIGIISCENKPHLVPGEGFIEVTGGKVWYRITGQGEGLPLILLHGGPGAPSYYLNPLSALAEDRPVIFFDQLGCGRSDRISSDSLMSVEFFVEQLEQVRQTLGIGKFHLYGQSWGTMLGTEYYLKYPDRVSSLILSSPALSVPLWIRDAGILIETLPDSLRQAIREAEASGIYDSPAYQNAITGYYQRFVSRNLPWTYDIDSTFAGLGANVYQTMWGPSEFKATGILKDFDITQRLGEIGVPVLLIYGEFDEVREETALHYQSLIPGSRLTKISGAGHLTMQDNPNEDIRAIREFLQGIE